MMAKVDEVLDGLYVVGGPGFTSQNDCMIYLVRIDRSSYVLIDAGTGRGHRNLMDNIRSLDVDPSLIRGVFLTHCHIDHVGGAAKLKEEFDLRMVAHEHDSDALESGDARRSAAHLYGMECPPVEIDEKITEDGAITIAGKEFHIYHIPGHTPGSIAVGVELDGQKVLFAQDVHGPLNSSWGSDRRLYEDSLRKLLRIDPDILCEGHFGVIRPSSHVKRFVNDYLGW